MNKKSLLAVALALIVGAGANAKPRTKAQLQDVAMKAINSQLATNSKAQRNDKPAMLKQTANYSVVGYSNGGFAVVANDDKVPALLGCSMTQFADNSNENFVWWLSAIDEAIADLAANGSTKVQNIRRIAPDANKYPTQVGPLMTTRWTQEEPYNNLCPTYSSGRSMTGCVATALAQVLKYHQYPDHGIGSSSVIAPNGQTITANFYEHYYNWDMMLDDYSAGYTDQQANEVAVLMRDIGVASKMNYKSPDQGSGANSDIAAEGLKTYFGFEGLQYVERINYSEAEWMDLVFNELSQNGPIFYGGYSNNGGHAFVLHGYRADGFVYVNWGWGGDADGYYDISLLNPKSTSYAQLQDMIIGIKGEAKDLLSETITTTQGGQLQSFIAADKVNKIGELTISGPINEADIELLNQMANSSNGGELHTINLTQTTLPADALPEKAFYGCNRLQVIKLPSSIKSVGDGAFGYCTKLKSVDFGENSSRQFAVEDNMLYTSDGKQLICALPCVAGEISPKRGIENVHKWAFAGCQTVSKLTLPASVASIGKEAMAGMLSMKELRVARQGVPQLEGEGVFTDVRTDQCQLFVRRDYKSDYQSASQWSEFGNMTEYGTTIKATNAARKYGEDNPKFGYKVTGDKLNGTPELVCEASKESPAGQYAIKVQPGTITEEAVDYVDGTLNVKKAALEATFAKAEYSRLVGEELGEIDLTYTGFVLDDDASCIDTPPTVVCEATAQSPAGSYEMTLAGGSDDCYDIGVSGAAMLIVETPTGIILQAVGQEFEPADIYTADGKLAISNATSLNGLEKGVYIIKGKKIIIK